MNAALFTFLRTMYIDPSQVCGHITMRLKNDIKPIFYPWTGVIVAGDWDQSIERVEFREHPVFISCKMRFIEGAEWPETPIYQFYEARIKDGNPHGDAPTKGALDARYRSLDAIFASIRQTGNLSAKRAHLIRISFARDGGLFRGPNGRHRLAAAILAGVKRVPCRVLFVHPQGYEHYEAALSASP